MRLSVVYIWGLCVFLVACSGASTLEATDDVVDVTVAEDADTGPSDGADVADPPDSGPVASCAGQADGAACLSDSPCSEEGACVDAVCVPTTPCACAKDGDCAPPEDLCTGVMVCDTSGELPACVLDTSAAVVCPPASEACQVNQCDPGTGACTEVTAPDGAVCDDGDACTADDGCLSGVCAGATLVVCDDEAFCNGVETCDGVVGCVAGEPPPLDDGVDCTLDTCDEDQDAALHTPDDQACSNGFFCDGAEVCHALEGCQPGEPPVVDDGVACTDDACSEADDAVVHVANDGLCDDGLFCTGVETCDSVLGCQQGPPPVLDDGVACTVDTCDDALDEVVHTPDPSLCDDDNPCTAELCGVMDGCSHEADDSGLCSDDDPCTSGDHCSESVCVGTPILSEGPVCNNVDDDCDGVTDEDCAYRLDGHMFGDGFGTGSDESGHTLDGTVGTPRIVGTSSNGTWTLRSGLPSAEEN